MRGPSGAVFLETVVLRRLSLSGLEMLPGDQALLSQTSGFPYIVKKHDVPSDAMRTFLSWSQFNEDVLDRNLGANVHKCLTGVSLSIQGARCMTKLESAMSFHGNEALRCKKFCVFEVIVPNPSPPPPLPSSPPTPQYRNQLAQFTHLHTQHSIFR